MHIYWKGKSCFNISVSQTKGESISILIDPIDPKTNEKISKQKGDLYLFTNNKVKTKDALGIKDAVFVINNPGEYEIKGIHIKGINGFNNHIFTLEAEDIKICHLGNISEDELSSKQLTEIGRVDVLMIPVGGDYVIDAKTAVSIANQIEPKIIIPMVYKTEGDKSKLDTVKSFVKEMGETGEPQDKLLLKKKDLSTKEGEIIVLNP